MNNTNGNNALSLEIIPQPNQDSTYRPTYKSLKLGSLQIDKYQRSLNYSDCKKYSKDFDWYLVGVLLVSYRDGEYYIVDGQHRKVLLQMKGVDETLCQIITGLTYKEEAALFKKYNTMRKSLGRGDLLAADVESGDKRAIKLMQVVNKSPYACERNKQEDNAKGKINIHGVAALEAAYDALGDKGLAAMLDLVHKTWPGEKDAVGARMITGLTCFFKKFPIDEIDTKNFIEKLGKEIPTAINRKAMMDEKYSPTSGSKGIPTARVIYKCYNDRLSASKKLPYEF